MRKGRQRLNKIIKFVKNVKTNRIDYSLFIGKDII